MAEYILRFFFIIPLLLIGCGTAYYTKDKLLVADDSPKWTKDTDLKNVLVFNCNPDKIRILPTKIATQRVSEAFVGIPIYPSKNEDNKKLSFTKYELQVEYESDQKACSENDLWVDYNNERYTPDLVLSIHTVRLNKSCKYTFPINVNDLTECRVSFNKNAVGCDVSPVRIRRSSNYHYNASPW